MLNELEKALGDWLGQGRNRVGQIAVVAQPEGFALCHRDDLDDTTLPSWHDPVEAAVIARFDDAKNFRPLKTAPNLAHGWRLHLRDLSELRIALDYFYPGRLAWLRAFDQERFVATPLRETLARQSGMYRVAAKISDEAVDRLVAGFCRSEGGCLRTIMWKRDPAGNLATTQLPAEKFDPAFDQTGEGKPTLPLLCQEICPLFVAAAREAVKEAGPANP